MRGRHCRGIGRRRRGQALNTPNPKTTVIIDYIDAKGGKGKPKGGGEEAVDHSAGHYELLGGVWADADLSTNEVDPSLAFVVDLRGFPTGSRQAIEDAFAAWEGRTAGDLVASLAFANADVKFGDGVNTYSMRNLGGRVLAIAYPTWDDANDKIDPGEEWLEFDVIHNFTVSWATDETAGNTPGKWFDVRGTSTHELGHVFGMADSGKAHERDKAQTMYAYISAKDTSTRTLELDGDVPGIQSAFLGYGAAP